MEIKAFWDFMKRFLIVGCFFVTYTFGQVVTRETIKYYRSALIEEVEGIQKGLTNQFDCWYSSFSSHLPNSAIQFLAEKVEGRIVTNTEARIWPIFKKYPRNKENFEQWLDEISEDKIVMLNNLVNTSYTVPKDVLQTDSYNESILHKHSVDKWFPGNNLTIEELNYRLEEIPDDTYVEELNIRILADFLHKKLIVEN